MRKALLKFAHRAETVVILPHTIRGHEDLLETLGDRVHVFCRDVVSYAHVLDHAPRAKAYLGHDMAFHLDIAAIMGSPEAAGWEERYQAITGDRSYVGDIFFTRVDAETKARLPGGVDISELYGQGVWPGSAEFAAYCMIRALRDATQVTTDRLHVGILAGLLGKPTRLFDNSYGKNREVFRHSIRRFLPSVSFFGYLRDVSPNVSASSR
jgi:exopolysaccharide biosynthesis predicted pyruvyltransferase EpsI